MPKTYKMQDALAIVRLHGFTEDVSNQYHAADNRLVTIHRDWLPDGTEIARLELARGKYSGCSAGFMARPREKSAPRADT